MSMFIVGRIGAAVNNAVLVVMRMGRTGMMTRHPIGQRWMMMRNLDWLSALLLLAGVIFLRGKHAVGWLLCAASCVAAIFLFLSATYQNRPLWGKVAQSVAMLAVNLSNYFAWSGE